MTRPNHPPIVYVEWSDATALSAKWQDREEMVADAEAYSGAVCATGFLLQDGADYLVMAAAYNHHNDDAAHGFVIPRSEVRHMVQLRPAKGMERT